MGYKIASMRFLLAMLAILVLVANPAVATATQVVGVAPCGLEATEMPGMDHAGPRSVAVDPCCDHATKHGKSDQSCARACATACAIAAALPATMMSLEPHPVVSVLHAGPMASRKAHDPSRLERPPRSI